jgi:hypothetical protein
MGILFTGKLKRLYRKPYKWLCEGVATVKNVQEFCWIELKRDLQARGNLPVVLSQAMADSRKTSY